MATSEILRLEFGGIARLLASPPQKPEPGCDVGPFSVGWDEPPGACPSDNWPLLMRYYRLLQGNPDAPDKMLECLREFMFRELFSAIYPMEHAMPVLGARQWAVEHQHDTLRDACGRWWRQWVVLYSMSAVDARGGAGRDGKRGPAVGAICARSWHVVDGKPSGLDRRPEQVLLARALNWGNAVDRVFPNWSGDMLPWWDAIQIPLLEPLERFDCLATLRGHPPTQLMLDAVTLPIRATYEYRRYEWGVLCRVLDTRGLALGSTDAVFASLTHNDGRQHWITTHDGIRGNGRHGTTRIDGDQIVVEDGVWTTEVRLPAGQLLWTVQVNANGARLVQVNANGPSVPVPAAPPDVDRDTTGTPFAMTYEAAKLREIARTMVARLEDPTKDRETAVQNCVDFCRSEGWNVPDFEVQK